MKKLLLTVIVLLPVLLNGQRAFYSAEDLYELVLKNNTELAEKDARKRAADLRVKEAASRGAPTLNFESTINYISNPDRITVEAGSFGEIPIPMPAEDTTFEMSGNSYYDFRLILDQPLFTWGKIYNAREAAREGASAAELDKIKTREQLKTGIQINCLALHYLKEIEVALSKQNELLRRIEVIAQENLNNGMILRAEYLDSRSIRLESDNAAEQIRFQIENTVLNISRLCGVKLDSVMISTESFFLEEHGDRDETVTEAIGSNRDLAMLRHSVEAEERKSRIQKGNYYFKPDLAFHAELSYSGSYFPLIQEGWKDEDRENLTLTLAIRTPLADFGGMHYSAKAAEEDLTAARASYQSAREEVELMIRQIMNNMELNKLNIAYLEERLETDKEIIAQREKEWLTGYGNETDLLIKQVEYYSRRIQLYRELIDMGTNHYTLDNLKGNEN